MNQNHLLGEAIETKAESTMQTLQTRAPEHQYSTLKTTLEPAEVRRSQRIASKPAVNYARMNQGPKHLTIGKSEPSKHFVEFDHEDDDLTITPIDYSQNYYHRGLKEAIRIYEKWPCINQDEGRTYLPPIYHNLLSRPPAKPEMTNIQDETIH